MTERKLFDDFKGYGTLLNVHINKDSLAKNKGAHSSTLVFNGLFEIERQRATQPRNHLEVTNTIS